jgi:HEAT repeat protein
VSGENSADGTHVLIEDAVAFLIDCLGHEYFDVRASAALALGRAGTKARDRAAPLLEKQISDDNVTAAESAALALGMMESKKSIPVLKGIVDDKRAKYSMRTYAAVGLGLCGDKSAARSLTTVLSMPKENEHVRAACMMAMAMAKDEASAFTFMSLMMNTKVKGDLRAMAATALGKLGYCEIQRGKKKQNVVETLVRFLSAGKLKRKIKLSAIMAVCALGPSGKVSGETLMEMLSRTYRTERNSEVRSFVLMGMSELAKEGSVAEPAKAFLRDVLRKETNPALLTWAVAGAGIAKDTECIPDLRKIFKEKTAPGIRSAAATSLGLLKDIESTPMFLDVITGKGAPSLRASCCLALGLMGSTENLEALPKLREILLGGKNPKVRGAAGMALMLLDDRGAIDILLEAVKVGDNYLRMSVLVTIGYSRNLRAVKPLIDLFKNGKDITDEVRAVIVAALGYIVEESDESVIKRLSKHYNPLLGKYDALVQIMNLL